MSGRTDRIVVVGASVAGVAAVEELRRLGHDGEIVMVGGEAHAPYDRPPLTKAVLAGRRDADDCALRSAGWADELDVELRRSTSAVDLDLRTRTVTLADGEELAYDGLVVATGATPRMLAGPELDGALCLRTLDDALALRDMVVAGARLVVVGGGFIGAEVAATARRLGAQVTIVERDAAPLFRALGEAVAALVADVHAGEGVQLRCGVPVAGIEGRGRVERVLLADGTAIAADAVVVGLGVAPATGWLERSGLGLRDGVVCDAYCRASVPGVVAAGDVARWSHPRLGSVRVEHWENAVAQGRHAAAALLSAAAEPYAPVPYVWSEQYDHKLQVVGHRRPGDELVVLDGTLEERRFVGVYVRGDEVTAAVTLDRAASAMRIRRVLRGPATVADVEAALAGDRASPGSEAVAS